MVGELETPLERTPRNTAMKEIHIIAFIGTLADNDKLSVTHLYIEILRTEAGHRDADLIIVFAGFHDVVGWVTVRRWGLLGGIKQ